MKKKFLLTLLGLVCALCCAIGLVACGGGDDDDNGASDRIYIVRASDGVDLGENPDLGECTYSGNDFAAVMDFKICTKNADGTFVDLNAADVTVTYKYNGAAMENAPTSAADFNAGSYTIEFKYNGSTASAQFTVKKSDNVSYAATPSKSGWKYGETGAVLSVSGVTQLSAYYLSEADYNAVKDAADKDDQLASKRTSYDPEQSSDMTPGTYYLFAECVATDNYNAAYTDFKKVTVVKGELAIDGGESVTVSTGAYTYGYDGKVGDIKLADISIIGNSDSDVSIVDGFGQPVSGEFVWQNPDTPINASGSGNRYPVKFVPDEAVRDLYNEKENVGQAEITVNKGCLTKPSYLDSEWRYDGTASKVYIGGSGYENYVTATRDGHAVQIEKDGDQSSLGDITEVGTYIYTLSLKDKANFYWVEPDVVDPTDTADLTLSRRILPKESYIGTRGSAPQLVPDRNGVIKLAIAPYVTPYKVGTLTAKYDDEAEEETMYTADIAIVNESGVDYLQISNIVNTADSGASSFPIRFTAKGADNYDDIDRTIYDFGPTFDITCPIAAETALIVYNGTPASVLFDNYVRLKTTVGDYKLKMKVEDDWVDVANNATLPELNVVYDFKLVFDVAADVMDSRVNADGNREVEFTIKAVEFSCPITAGSRIEVAAGTTTDGIWANYELENEYGAWYVEYQHKDGMWYSVTDGYPIDAGETKCRLYFVSNGSLMGDPPTVELTLVGTV